MTGLPLPQARLTSLAHAVAPTAGPRSADALHPAVITLAILCGKWTLRVYDELRGGTRRFGQLKRALPGVTQTVLTHRLRELEGHGLVVRTVHPEVPPRVEYALTDLGRALEHVVAAMGRWGEQYDLADGRRSAAKRVA